MKNCKVVVFGKGEAGKSTLIRTLIPDAVNIEHDGRTVAMDFGRLTVGKKVLHFYGTPGQRRFDAVRDVLSEYAHCALVIFDGSRDLDGEDHTIVREVTALDLPYLAIVNLKQGRPARFGDEEISRLCTSPTRFAGAAVGDITDRTFSQHILSSLQALL